MNLRLKYISIYLLPTLCYILYLYVHIIIYELEPKSQLDSVKFNLGWLGNNTIDMIKNNLFQGHNVLLDYTNSCLEK